MRILTFILGATIALGGVAQQKWTLQQCVARAEEKNLTVRDAELESDLADKAHDQAYWSFLPNLNGGGTHGYNWGKTIDRYTNSFATTGVRTNNFYLSSDVVLYEGGRKRNELKQADLNEQASGKALEAARNNIRTETVRGFLNVLGLRERIRSADLQAGLTRNQIDRVQALVEAGRSARTELLDLQAQLASEEYTLTDLHNQSDLALLQLGQLLHLEPAEMNSFDVEAPAISALAIAEPTANEDDVLRNVLTTNPAYAQADLSAQSAERAVVIAHSGLMPYLSFNAAVGTGYSGRNVETIGSTLIGQQLIGATSTGDPVYIPTFKYDTRTRDFGKQLDDNLNESATLSLNVPIFNNKRNSYLVDQARIRHEEAKNKLENQRFSLQRDVQNALTSQRGAFRQYQSAQASIDASQEAQRFAQERFEHGAITALELTTAKTRLDRAIADGINAKYTYLMAQKSLDILQGLPLTL